MGSVVVVGSINVDVVMHVPGFPAPGVTLLADRVERSPGGKGANQAVAAARAGAATRLLGAVGDDGDGAPRSTPWSRPGWTCRESRPAAGGPPGPRS